MDSPALAAAAELLHRCRERGEVIDALPARCRPTTVEDGYRVQARVPAVAADRVAGWKIAATNPAGQRHIGVDRPLAGRLLARRIRQSPAQVSMAGNHMRVAEAEFAFVLGADLPARAAPYTRDQVMAACTALHPAIELPDSRFADFVGAGVAQLVADNACAHFFVLGAAATDWRGFDLAAHTVEVLVDGRHALTGTGADVLGDPRDAMVWIANANAARGEALLAGDVVTTGVCGRPLPIDAGQVVRADFGVLGTVEVTLVE